MRWAVDIKCAKVAMSSIRRDAPALRCKSSHEQLHFVVCIVPVKHDGVGTAVREVLLALGLELQQLLFVLLHHFLTLWILVLKIFILLPVEPRRCR